MLLTGNLQAAIGSIALDTARSKLPEDHPYIDLGKQVSLEFTELSHLYLHDLDKLVPECQYKYWYSSLRKIFAVGARGL